MLDRPICLPFTHYSYSHLWDFQSLFSRHPNSTDRPWRIHRFRHILHLGNMDNCACWSKIVSLRTSCERTNKSRQGKWYSGGSSWGKQRRQRGRWPGHRIEYSAHVFNVKTSPAGSCSIFPQSTWALCPKRWDFLCIQVTGWCVKTFLSVSWTAFLTCGGIELPWKKSE